MFNQFRLGFKKLATRQADGEDGDVFHVAIGGQSMDLLTTLVDRLTG